MKLAEALIQIQKDMADLTALANKITADIASISSQVEWLMDSEVHNHSIDQITAGDIHIDRTNRIVRINTAEKVFPQLEFDILCLLATRPNRTFSREQIKQVVWKGGMVTDTTLNVSICNTRRLIAAIGGNGKNYIILTKGIGYYLSA